MNNISYIAISYKCNQRCLYCPCSKDAYKMPYIKLEQLKELADKMIETQGASTIVVSGGEPTIHPDFLEFISYLLAKKVKIQILSNGERFSDASFFKSFCELAGQESITITTTIHSHIKAEHEHANQTVGSFDRTITGLTNLLDNGFKVIVKHCITRANYLQLPMFYEFINEKFKENADMQLCSIDYCGMENDLKAMQQEKLSFVEVRKPLEDMLDIHIEEQKKGNSRIVYCINMPLCSADPYYWSYFVKKSVGNYSLYASPDKKTQDADEIELSGQNVGTFGGVCKQCKARPICPGTYKTAFQYFGDTMVKCYGDK